MSPRNLRPLLIAAIIVALIIGVSIFVLYRKNTDTGVQRPSEQAEKVDVRTVQTDDHIQGSPEAPVTLIVYSDFECPFCKDYHQTIRLLLNEYGKDGRLAWVFRQFPLAQLHSQAPTEALASECVAQIGGNDAFWMFADHMFETTPGNNKFNLAELPNVAALAGVDRAAFEACMRSGNLMSDVEEDFDEAIAAGGDGTPFTILIAAGQQTRINGGQPYAAMKAVMETVLRQIGATGIVRPTEAQNVDAVFTNATGTDTTATTSSPEETPATSSTTQPVIE